MKPGATMWHYTTGTKYRSIRRDGYIKTTDVFIDPHERPAAWFSTIETWEPTASKGIYDNGIRRTATMDEMIHFMGGLVRIGISPKTPGIVSWYEFKRVSGITARIAKILEVNGYRDGTRPEWWYASFDPVPREWWESVQVYKDGQWIDVDEMEEQNLGLIKAFHCVECGAVEVIPGGSLYVCANCDNTFGTTGGQDDNGVCPRCGNRSLKFDDVSCKNCGGEVEQINAWRCQDCHYLIPEGYDCECTDC